MKAIQTFWINDENKQFNCGGWINKRYEYISWSLSFALLKKQFTSIELYGNDAGIEMLKQVLGLPYNKSYSVLDTLPPFMNEFWTLGKLAVYSAQNEPFIHVDGDVFWFKNAESDLYNAELIAQSLELDDPMYHTNWKNSMQFLNNPDFLQTDFAKRSMACNTGIIGGHNTELFKDFYQEICHFLEKNIEFLRRNKEKFPFYEIYLEQVQLMCFSNFRNKNFKFLKKPVFRTNFEEVTDFLSLDSTHQPSFIHLVATFKQRIQHCNQMEFWLYKIWPEQLQKINLLCETDNTLRNEYKILLNPINEKRLPQTGYIYFSPKDILQNPYTRTNSLINISLEQKYSENNTLIIKEINNEYITDAYVFETNRLLLVQDYTNFINPKNLYQHFENTLLFFTKGFDSYHQTKIKLNTKKTLKSKYNWFNELKYNTDYYYDFQLSSDGICFQELLLTPLACQLLSLYSDTEITIGELYEKWLNIYQTFDSVVNRKKFTDTIKELINLQQLLIIA